MNVMKNKLIAALSVILAAGVFSCADDVSLSGLPKQGPFVTPLDVPGLLFAGIVTDVKATANGTLTNPVTSMTFEVFKKGSTTVEKSGTVTPTTTTGVVTVTWTGASSGLSTLGAGDYVMVVTGTNANGKTSASAPFSVPDYVVPQSCQVTGQVTIIMQTTSSITAPTSGGPVISAIGSMAGSGWGTDINMTYIKPGVYCVALPLVASDAFKFRMNASWGTQEKKDNCNDGDNRVAPGASWPAISIQNVPKWPGFGC
jgi:hypothetical protein